MTQPPPRTLDHPRTYLFGPFHFEPATGLLADGRDETSLPPRAAAVLALLLARPGTVIAKRALLEAVWPDTHVTDSSLTDVVSLLRQALRDDPREPRYIQTLHRRGYRFVAPVTVGDDDDQRPAVRGPGIAGQVGSGRRWSAVLPWTLAALAAGIALWAVQRSPPAAPPATRLELVLPADRRLDLDTLGPSLAVAPGGRAVALVARPDSPDSDRETALYLRILEQPEAVLIGGTEGGAQPFFSPDGRWLAFFADGKLKKVAVEGGPPLTLAETPGTYHGGGTWGDGGVIVFSDGARLHRVAATGGATTALSDPPSGSGKHRAPAFLPGGHAVLFNLSTEYRQSTAALDLDSGEITVLIEDSGHQPIFVGDRQRGHLLYVQDGTLLATAFDPIARTVVGSPLPVVDQVLYGPYGDTPQLAVAGDLLVFATGGVRRLDRDLVWIAPDGTARPSGLARGPWWLPELSPDGRRVVLQSDSGPRADVFVFDLARGVSTRLTREPVYDGAPIWGPGDDDVTFAHGVQGEQALLTMAAGSVGEPTLLFPDLDGRPYANAWSADGRILLFDLRTDRGDYDLWRFEPGAEPALRPLLTGPFNEQESRLSPDGRWLAYLADDSGRFQVYVTDFPALGHKVTLSADGASDARWSADGRRLYYRSDRRLMAVDFAQGSPLLPSPPRLVLETDAQGLAVSAGEPPRFLMVQDSGEAIRGPRRLQVLLHWRSALPAR